MSGSRAAGLGARLRVGPCGTVFETIFGGIPGSPVVCAVGRDTTMPVDNLVDNLRTTSTVSPADSVDNPTTKLAASFLPHPNMLWF
jgi:hypothetical protein